MQNLIPAPRMSEFILDEFMIPMGLTAQDVSEHSGISITELRAVLSDEQEMTPELSKKLGNYFGISEMMFYDIQLDLKKRVGERELQYA